MKMKLLYLQLAALIVLSGCQSSGQSHRTMADAIGHCNPLTYQCHQQRKNSPISKSIQAKLERANALSRSGKILPAIELLEGLTPGTKAETAAINYQLALVHDRNQMDHMVVYYAQAALSGQHLDSEKHATLLRLELLRLFRLGYFDEAKSKIGAYYTYMGISADRYLDPVLLYIALQQDDKAAMSALREKMNKSSQKSDVYASFVALTSVKIEQAKQPRFSLPKEPVVKYQVPYDYPREAAYQRIEGHISLQFDIDSQGKPVNITVLESSPTGVFDQAGIDALTQWRYLVNLDTNGKVIEGQAHNIEFRWGLNY
ncbi:energy transducer TonB [Pseudoalteromonas rubra]|uniref:energy transducer TonB n=1 Tax=Pseudoalteromonas rubra TaxID=43658 RepID=UPI000F7A92EB|nr:energy transducer TonB [Pseudoalteromonas rubra]